jgi:hypothetical protein
MAFICNIMDILLENPKLLTLVIGIVFVFAIGISIGTMNPNSGALRFIVATGGPGQSSQYCCVYGLIP